MIVPVETTSPSEPFRFRLVNCEDKRFSREKEKKSSNGYYTCVVYIE